MHDPVFSALTLPPPGLSTADAEAIAARDFGIQSSARPLSSERDQNFQLTTSGGEQFVLRIANPADDPSVIDLQARALLHIQSEAPALPVQCVTRTRNGALSSSVSTADGKTYTAWVISYSSGVPVRSIEANSTTRRAIGASLAELDRALRTFAHPAAERALAWDLQQAPRMYELLPHIRDPARRGLAEQFLQRFDRHAAGALGNLRRQVIHNDFNLSNLLVDPDRPDRLSAILDFGDMLRAPLAVEVAVAAAYHIGEDADPLSQASELVAAYHEVNPLDEGELALLFPLMCARLATLVAISEWRAALYPHNRAHIMKNNASAWRALERLRNVTQQQAASRFVSACYPDRRFSKRATEKVESDEQLQARRAQRLGPAYRLFYDKPLHIVRGEGVWLYDVAGRAYLDAYNNVPHVGHCHPRIVEALRTQAETLNTHTRYLHETVVDYAERLAALASPLGTAMFTCTGSEANDLAVRIARACTGKSGIIATRHAYHGNTVAVAEFSNSYPSAEPASPRVRTVPAPDSYRGPAGMNDEQLARVYADHVREAIESLEAQGIGVAAFIVDSMFSSDGIITAPPDYLQLAVSHVRKAGGIFIADEVQAGFGRTGTHFWGFEHFGVVPDLMTLGKSMGNGHPLAAVLARAELVREFGARARYFNTFGGNAVSCTVGLAVLDVLEEERLQENALRVGDYLRTGLRDLAKEFALMGDVRGRGLFCGVELVNEREPATKGAGQIVNALRDKGVLVVATGPRSNVLKIRPPMVFSTANADQLLEALRGALRDLYR
jgi:4-aminobutyrate aminotransferase-like enzyme/Ser/Thr protein kinase RdoA (MazF antagonist)